MDLRGSGASTRCGDRGRSLVIMSNLDDWLAAAGTSIGANDVVVDPALRTALLDLTRDVAHGITRVAGPLTCYLIGVAVGRGADPAQATAAASAAVQEYLTTHPQQEEQR